MQQGQGRLEETHDGHEAMCLSPASQGFAESLAMWPQPRKKGQVPDLTRSRRSNERDGMRRGRRERGMLVSLSS